MKHLFLILFSFLSSSLCFGQDTKQKVYYLADTINVGPSNRILNIEKEAIFVCYVFYCRSIEANQYRYPAFIYSVNRSKTMRFSKRPKYKYLSWMELEKMLYDKGQDFDKFYDLEIVEKLPNRTYKKNKVNLSIVNLAITY